MNARTPAKSAHARLVESARATRPAPPARIAQAGVGEFEGADVMGRPLPFVAPSLAAALAGHAVAVAVETVVASFADGGSVDKICDALVTAVLDRNERLDAALVLVDDACRAAADQHELRRSLPLSVAAGWLTQWPTAGAAFSEADVGAKTTTAAVEAAAQAAGDAVRARLKAGASATEIEGELVDRVYAAPTVLGALVPIVASAVELRPRCSADVGDRLLAQLAATLAAAVASRESAKDVDQPAADHLARVAQIVASREAIFAAQDPSRGAAFQDVRFRAYLTDGAAAGAERAMAKAMAYGVPRTTLVGSLALAACERVLRFDEAIDRSPWRRESWFDVAWLLRIVEGIRRLEVRHPRACWIDLTLWATWQVHSASVLDGQGADQHALPEPAVLAQTWDHGPEIARVCGAVARRKQDEATAIMRGYLMMGLPEAPLGAALVEAVLLDVRGGSSAQAAMTLGAMSAAAAAFAGLGTNPHRERVLAAAFRIQCAERADASAAFAAQACVDRHESGREPTSLAPMPWLRR